MADDAQSWSRLEIEATAWTFGMPCLGTNQGVVCPTVLNQLFYFFL
jgi:hypothetical protein